MNDRGERIDAAADFLTTVLPVRREDEVYRVEIFPRPDFHANNFLDIRKMAAHLLRFGRRPYNAYFALATFPWGGNDRRAEHALRFGSLWADLDCGGTKNFVSKDAALAHVECFPLPASAIVDSGRGLHVYWCLAEPAEGDEVDRLIGLVKGLGQQWGADPGATLRSQILRPPGTTNVDSIEKKKDGRDCPVRLLHLECSAARYSLDDFVAAGIRPAEKPERQAPVAGRLPQGERHRSLVVEAARLRHLGYDADEIDGALQVINRKRCDLPKAEDEVREIAEWAGQLKPGSVAVPRFKSGPGRGPIHVA